MPSKASYKSKGGKKDSAAKNTFNPPAGSGPAGDQVLDANQERSPNNEHGQFGEAGNAPLMKK